MYLIGVYGSENRAAGIGVGCGTANHAEGEDAKLQASKTISSGEYNT